MNEFRQDPITGQTVIISADRDHRPQQFDGDAKQAKILGASSTPKFDASDADCPFCRGRMNTPPIVARYGTDLRKNPAAWDVCVVPNLYPVLDRFESGDGQVPDSNATSSNLALGVHEVVIESASHATGMSQLHADHFRFMLRAYRDRFVVMSENDKIRFALAIKNSGRDAGASLQHTHSQLFGLPIVPEQLERELLGCQRYYDKNVRCIFCDLIEEIFAQKSLKKSPKSRDRRIVGQSESFVAWCPYASRVAYEVWLAPRHHHSRFEETSDDMLDELAELFQSLIRKVDQHPRIHAFNYLLHSLPFDSNQHDEYHWHIEILPRMARQAGFEWGTGIFINTVLPNQAAQELRLDS